LVANHFTEPEKGEKEGREKERRGEGHRCRSKKGEAEPRLAGTRSVAPISYIDVAAQHGTASPLHSHDSPLHRHPISHDTYGERSIFPCSPPDSAIPAMALHTVSA